MNKYSLKEYKEAKTMMPHLNAIIKVIDLATKGFQHFKSYLPVIKILKVMEEQRTLLELHKKKYDEVLKTKGKSNN